MTERTQPQPAIGEELSEQVEDFCQHVVRLFEAGQQPFISYASHEEPYRGGEKYVRYQAESTLALITLFDTEDPRILSPEAEKSTLLPAVRIDTPLPVHRDWPNAYVRETFTLAGRSLRAEGGAYEYRLEVAEYTPEGISINDRDRRAIEAELRPIGDQRDLGEEDLLEDLTNQRLEDLNVRRLLEAARTFPELTSRFTVECTPEHFAEQLATLASLSASDEVGYDPNPYIRQ